MGRGDIRKKLLELKPKIGIVETTILDFRVVCSKRSFAIQDFRDGGWCRFTAVDDAVSKLVELNQREEGISEFIKKEAKSLRAQEKWERRRETV